MLDREREVKGTIAARSPRPKEMGSGQFGKDYPAVLASAVHNRGPVCEIAALIHSHSIRRGGPEQRQRLGLLYDRKGPIGAPRVIRIRDSGLHSVAAFIGWRLALAVVA